MKPSPLFLLASLCLQLCTSMTIITKPHLDEIPSEPNGHQHEQLIHSPKEPQSSSEQITFKQLTNGSTPTGWIQIGTPKKWLYVIFDTGSDKLVAKTWETISAELDSVDQGITKDMIMPSETLYNHDASSSYLRRYLTNPTTGDKEPMQSSITYGSGTAITDVGGDDIHVGDRTLKNFTIMEITADSLQLLHTSKGIAGVLGLQHMKNKSLGNSLFSHLRDEDLLTSFAYCRGTGNNGTFIWGAPEPDGENVHEAEVFGQMHWAVKLGDIKVKTANSTDTTGDAAGDSTGGSTGGSTAGSTGGWIQKKAKVVQPSGSDGDSGDSSGGASGGDPLFDTPSDDSSTQAQGQSLANVCPNGGCTGILDTGSNIIAGPSNVMKAITATVNVSPDCSNFDSLPDILLNFGGYPVTVQASGYVMKVPKPSEPYGFGDGDGDASGGDGSADGSGDAGFVHGAGLEQKAVTTERARRAAIKRQWQMVFNRLHRNTGIDLRDIVNHVLKQENATKEEFLCMPALVPIDRDTVNGPLYIVGTPLLDSYYARWSFDKDAQSPKIHLQPLDDATICKDTSDLHKGDGFSKFTAKSLVRKEATGNTKEATGSDTRRSPRGPSERRPEEIRFPHWAKSLMHV